MAELAYILSASHSGSTLLARLLAGHPEVATVGELAPTHTGPLDAYRCSCRELFHECPFWRRVESEMRRRGARFDLDDFGTNHHASTGRVASRLVRPLLRGPAMELLRHLALQACPAWRREYPLRQLNNRLLIEVVSGLTGCRIVVDSSKRGLRLKFLLQIPGLAVKVIRLVRDGRAVALTYMDPYTFADASRPQDRGGGSGRQRNGEGLTMAEAAREWRRSNEEAEHLVRRLDPKHWIEVRYESLCADPGAALTRLHDFLGVSRSVANPRLERESHMLGNGMRLDSAPDVHLDDRWKLVLGPEELEAFHPVAGRLNKQYGYD